LATYGDFNNVNTTGFSSFSSSISTGLISGPNTIYLEVENAASSYTGVVVQGTVDGRGTVIVGATPELATWAMLGTGLSLVGLLRRRRRATLQSCKVRPFASDHLDPFEMQIRKNNITRFQPRA